MIRRTPAVLLALLAALPPASSAFAQAEGNGAAAAAHVAAPYQRTADDRPGGVVRLEMTIREFAPPRAGMPTIYLAGAVHIANPSFYGSLQEFLDTQDVVLFEGVKPPGAGSGEHDRGEQTPEQKAKATERRIRFLAMAIERYRAKEGGLPESLAALVEGSEGRIAQLLKGSLSDAWGHPIGYDVRAATPAPGSSQPPISDGGPAPAGKPGAPTFDVLSLGADAKAGGEGAASDLRFSDQKPLKKPEKGDRSGGIQQELADATGLVFQLTAMDHNKAHWRNSDLSMDQIQDRLEASGASADELFSMLEGTSFTGRLAGMMLSMMGSTAEGRTMLRLMMIEMLGRADELIKLRLPGGMEGMMAVILEDRNKVLVDDIRRIIEREPGIRTVGAIYGAGHLPGVERSLVADLGYRPAGDRWLVAMEVDADRDGVSPSQLVATRRMVGQMIQTQLDQAAREKARKEKKALEQPK
ncbi:MAG: hypothetical protein WD749_08110 [Phycisphaerales bacterium]